MGLNSASCGFSQDPSHASVPCGLLTGRQTGLCTHLLSPRALSQCLGLLAWGLSHRSQSLKTGPVACNWLLAIGSFTSHLSGVGALVKEAEISPTEFTFQWELHGGRYY